MGFDEGCWSAIDDSMREHYEVATDLARIE